MKGNLCYSTEDQKYRTHLREVISWRDTL